MRGVAADARRRDVLIKKFVGQLPARKLQSRKVVVRRVAGERQPRAAAAPRHDPKSDPWQDDQSGGGSVAGPRALSLHESLTTRAR